MPISIIWDDESHTIMRHMFEGTWNWSEYRSLLEDHFLANGPVDNRRVDIIADLLNSGPLPTGNAFPTLKFLANQAPDDVTGLFIVVGGGMFVQILGETFKKAYHDKGARIAFAKTLDDAYALIEEDRAEQQLNKS